MPAGTRRSAARLVAMVLLVALVGGCAGQRDESTAAGQSTTSTTVAPTTTTVPPLNAKELAWLKGVSAVRTKAENSFQAKGPVSLTRAIVLESSRKLASWGRQLRRLGAPSDRLQPAYTLVKQGSGMWWDIVYRRRASETRWITGANFAVAETGTLAVVESEGNGRMCLTLPETLITVMGIEKLVPTLEDASQILRVLARSATGSLRLCHSWLRKKNSFRLSSLKRPGMKTGPPTV